MSGLLFATVGTTAIGNPTIGSSELAGIAKQYLNTPRGQKDQFAKQHELEKELVKAHAAFWAGYEGRYPAEEECDGTSAELTSTIPLLDQQPSIKKGIFLGSATSEGRLAANVNCAALAKIWARGTVSVAIVPGLEERFTRVTPALEKILDDYHARTAGRVFFNVTGGFKGVIPSITYLAMQHTGWSIYYQYQGLNIATEVFFSEPGEEEESAELRSRVKKLDDERRPGHSLAMHEVVHSPRRVRGG